MQNHSQFASMIAAEKVNKAMMKLQTIHGTIILGIIYNKRLLDYKI